MHALTGEIIMRLDIQVTVQIARGESICSPRLLFKLANILLLCREPPMVSEASRREELTSLLTHHVFLCVSPERKK